MKRANPLAPFSHMTWVLALAVGAWSPLVGQTPPPDADTYHRIRQLLLDTPLGDYDADFLKRVYALDPDAAKIVGTVMSDPALAARNMRLGEIRAEMDLMVWERLLRDNPLRVEFTNQGKNNGVRSDLDYTLYYLAEEVGIPLEEMIRRHSDMWAATHDGLRPERVEIAVMNGDAFYPDWRNELLTTAEHRVEIRRNLRVLRSLPEAYFVPGANKQQVHNRALLQGETTLLEYDVAADELRVERGPAREIAQRYQDVHPQYDYKNALGNLIQNPREFFHHLPEPGNPDNATEALRRAKYFNRVVNEGLGGLSYFANSYMEIAQSGLPETRKSELQRTWLRRALQPLGLDEATLTQRVERMKRVVDISMRIELDKIGPNPADYNAMRAEYFSDYRSQAEVTVAQTVLGSEPLTPAQMEQRILAEQERLFGEDQTRAMVESIRAGLQHSARRDLTPRGALKNALRFEADPETGRPRAVLDPARVEKVAFERATEVALLFELVNSSRDPQVRALAQQIIDDAPTPELRVLYRQLSEVTTAQVDRFLEDGPVAESNPIRRGYRGIEPERLLERKLERVRAAGVPLVPPEEAERTVPDSDLRDHILRSQAQRLNPSERVALGEVWTATRQVSGEFAQEMYGKATGLMMGSSAVNLIRAYQTGDEFAFRHAIFSEALNYMPDVVEIPFTVFDAFMQAQRGDYTGLTWNLPLMGALKFAPGVGQMMLLYNVSSGVPQIARTYIVSRMDDDLLEQAFRSRPVDGLGNPLPEPVRARRNPFQDAPAFRGDPPRYPIFHRLLPVPEDTMSDLRLANEATTRFAGVISQALTAEGLEEGSTAWLQRSRELARKFGFDLPYYERMRRMYEHVEREHIRPYVLARGSDDWEKELQRVLEGLVRSWYQAQPDGYQRELQGYFDVFLGSQEEALIQRLVSHLVAEYHRQDEMDFQRRAAEEADREALSVTLAAMERMEKQLLATQRRLQDQVESSSRSALEAVAEEARELADGSPTVTAHYPWAWSSEEMAPPEITVKVRGPVTAFAEPLRDSVVVEQVAARVGAPSGWNPGSEWAPRFEVGASGFPELMPVTVDYAFRAVVLDALDVEVGRAALTLPVVHYVPHPGTFSGTVTVEVMAATESGSPDDYRPYSGALVEVASMREITDAFGWAALGGLDAGSHTVTVLPRPGDERHAEASAMAEVVDPLDILPSEDATGANRARSERSGSVVVILPYRAPSAVGPADGGENEEGGEDGSGAGDDGAGEETGGRSGGEEGGSGGGEGGPGGADPTDPEGPVRELTELVRDAERLRDEALAACDYPAAVQAQRRVLADAEAWVTLNFPGGAPERVTGTLTAIQVDLAEVETMARAVEAARASLEAARERIRDRDPEQALDHLEAAFTIQDLPTCMTTPIDDLYTRIAADVEAIQQRTRDLAQTANEGCDYGTALLALERLEAEVPHFTWLREEGPRIRALEQAQRTARERGTQAQAARQNGEWDRAIALAQDAAGLAPGCERPLIEDFIQLLEREKAAAEAEEVADGGTGAGAGGASPDPSDPYAGIPIESSVIFLMDTSGSMGTNDRIGQARNAAVASIRNMPPNVEMALITYDGGCTGGWRVVHDFTREREPLLNAVQGLEPGGGTPMAPAVVFAQEHLARNARGAQGQIMLLSDGQNNCGSVRDAGNRLLRSTIPVRLDAVGLDLPPGGQAEADLDELVAASGNGARHSANTANELVSAFRRAFIGQQLRLDDPSQGPEIGATLRELFEAAVEHLRDNDPRSARGSLEEAVRQAPGSPAARYNLSLGYEAEGQLQRAVEQARHYLELSPSALDRGRVVERVTQLEAQLRETPTGLFNPAECRDLYNWARNEGSDTRDATRRALAFRIQNLAQRGDCQTARYDYGTFLERYGN
ncbi:MAG: VWA domain-containing protein [Gemmatimonadota bacterium]